MFKTKEKNVFRDKKKSKLPAIFLFLAATVLLVPYYLGQLIETIYADQKHLITETFDLQVISEGYQKHWFFSDGQIQLNLPFKDMSASMYNHITHRPIVMDQDTWLPKLEYATIQSRIAFKHPQNEQNNNNNNTISFKTSIPSQTYAQSSLDNQNLVLTDESGKSFFELKDLLANVLLLHQDRQVTGGMKSASVLVANEQVSAQFNNVSVGFNFLNATDQFTEGDLSYASDSALIKLKDVNLTANNIWGYYISILKGKTVDIEKRVEFRELNNGFLVIGPGSMEVQMNNINGLALDSIPEFLSLMIEIQTQGLSKKRQEDLRAVIEKLVPEHSTIKISDLHISMPGGEISGELKMEIPAIKDQKFESWLKTVKLDAELSVPREEIHKYIAAASQYDSDEIQVIMDDYVTDGYLIRDKVFYLALARLRDNKLSFNGKPYILSNTLAAISP